MNAPRERRPKRVLPTTLAPALAEPLVAFSWPRGGATVPAPSLLHGGALAHKKRSVCSGRRWLGDPFGSHLTRRRASVGPRRSPRGRRPFPPSSQDRESKIKVLAGMASSDSLSPWLAAGRPLAASRHGHPCVRARPTPAVSSARSSSTPFLRRPALLNGAHFHGLPLNSITT